MQDNMQLQICVYIYTHICTVECVYIHAQCSVYIYIWCIYAHMSTHKYIYIYTYIPHRDHLVHLLLSLHLLFQLTLCSHHSLQGLLRGYGYPFISSNPWLDSFIVGWNIKRILIIVVYTIPVRLPKFATKLPLTTIP